MLSVLGAAPAHAAHFTVINLADSGPGSLREAISNANDTPGFDSIFFDPALAGTITLSSGPLQVTDHVDILGTGAEILTVSGDDATRIFTIASVDSIIATIRGLTLTRGRVEDLEIFGGAIFVAHPASLNLIRTVISDSHAQGFGGAIFNDGGLTLIETVLSGNSAGLGGGGIINVAGDVSLSNSTFSDNHTTDTQPRGGGAIDSEGGTITDEGSTFSGNHTQSSGGALFLAPTTEVHLNGTWLSDNTARFFGGAIVSAGDVTMIGCTVDSNSVTDAELSAGGGISNTGTLRASFCNFGGNSSGRQGGGISNDGSLTLTRDTFTANASGLGGALANLGDATINDSVLSSNSAVFGGGAISTGLGAVVMSGSTLIGNFTTSPDGEGGGMEITSGDVNLRNSTVVGNGSVSGGGILNQGDLDLLGCTINGNIANDGGGLYNLLPVIIEGEIPEGSGIATVGNSTISGNRALSGGGIRNEGAMLLTNVTVDGNRALTGGGIHNDGGTTEAANTILSQSGSGLNCVDEVGGFILSRGFNLDGDGSCNFADDGDLSGTPTSPLDPRLGPLQDNGGPTETRALLAGSPAIDAGDNGQTAAATDQRGFRRVVDGNGDRLAVVDIGAFEFGAASLPGGGDLVSVLAIEPDTFLPAGTTSFALIVHYGPALAPERFVAKLNGQDITSLFDSGIDGSYEVVDIPLQEGLNRLILQVRGPRNDSPVRNVVNLAFWVGSPPVGPQ
ncbi:MAG: choice-of-anchor Q domain-containing protein [Pseudomonadota bacterium]|nr:choice-of-anchor Q domain-containing protein [Pseudomonadota bacterium]